MIVRMFIPLILLLLPFCIYAQSNNSSNDTVLGCPTIGTTAYILVSITPLMDSSDFYEMLHFYARLMPNNETISYHFYFGYKLTTTVVVKNLEEEVEDWRQNDYLIQLFVASLTTTSDQFQTDDPLKPLSPVMKTILSAVTTQNQQPATAIMKKQVENQQRVGLTHDLNTTNLQSAVNFCVFSTDDDNMFISHRKFMQQELTFQFPANVHQDHPKTANSIYASSMPTHNALHLLMTSFIDGPVCSLSDTRMYENFLKLTFAYNSTMNTMFLPWMGDVSRDFLSKCIRSLPEDHDSSTTSCSPAADAVYQAFAATATFPLPMNESFVSLLVTNVSCAAPHLVGLGAKVSPKTNVRIVTIAELVDVYEPLILPMEDNGYLNSSYDNQIIQDNVFYLYNYTTTCVNSIDFVPLIASTPYHRPKYLHIALDDMLWITICASISATTFGCIIYSHVKRSQKKQQELLKEFILQPRLYKAEPDNARASRLPWEVKSDKVHIDKDFMLGEGTVSNVYFGKLKGKAPIMQWIDRVDMKQFQDCAVAVRVPHRFDEPEEDQLTREIASMRRLRNHDHIALLLGWTNKNDLVCSILELTHMNLIKYLGQVFETVQNNQNGIVNKYIPYQVFYKIIWEICDGMAYIHSRNLVHRDLTARNILLTTGLRAKISGFGFCSEASDTKFGANSVLLRYLPVRWMGPECFQGRFHLQSDVWAFGVLLFEMFSLGNIPYEDLTKPEDIIAAVQQRERIPKCPKYATKRIYYIMQNCFQRLPERRPTFNQLKDIFSAEADLFYDNHAFVAD